MTKISHLSSPRTIRPHSFMSTLPYIVQESPTTIFTIHHTTNTKKTKCDPLEKIKIKNVPKTKSHDRLPDHDPNLLGHKNNILLTLHHHLSKNESYTTIHTSRRGKIYKIKKGTKKDPHRNISL